MRSLIVLLLLIPVVFSDSFYIVIEKHGEQLSARSLSTLPSDATSTGVGRHSAILESFSGEILFNYSFTVPEKEYVDMRTPEGKFVDVLPVEEAVFAIKLPYFCDAKEIAIYGPEEMTRFAVQDESRCDEGNVELKGDGTVPDIAGGNWDWLWFLSIPLAAAALLWYLRRSHLY